MNEAVTGLTPWKKLGLGLAAGTVLVGVFRKWVMDFLDSTLEIPPGIERPFAKEPEFDVVRKARGDRRRNPEVDLMGTELLQQSRFFRLLIGRMAVVPDIRRELELVVLVPNPVRMDLEKADERILERWNGTGRLVLVRKPPQLIRNSPLEGISAAVRNAVIAINPVGKSVPCTLPGNRSLTGNDREEMTGR